MSYPKPFVHFSWPTGLISNNILISKHNSAYKIQISHNIVDRFRYREYGKLINFCLHSLQVFFTLLFRNIGKKKLNKLNYTHNNMICNRRSHLMSYRLTKNINFLKIIMRRIGKVPLYNRHT